MVPLAALPGLQAWKEEEEDDEDDGGAAMRTHPPHMAIWEDTWADFSVPVTICEEWRPLRMSRLCEAVMARVLLRERKPGASLPSPGPRRPPLPPPLPLCVPSPGATPPLLLVSPLPPSTAWALSGRW